MEKQAIGISLHCWTQGPKSQSTNVVLPIQTPRGRNTDLVLEVSARLNSGVAEHGHMVTMDSAPPPCSHTLSSQKHNTVHYRESSEGTLVYYKLAMVKCEEKTQKWKHVSGVLYKLPKI